ncbi:hypothetical protein KM176_05285 [Pseudooceanicola sp. CBS1P-1]|uniref:Alpha/beta hydrolase n=1 Tax=Pseudooceanicola albus TaxID=2692189 RepID=A0A6L7FX41_9RHOB|nr:MULTISPECIES: hypothetical protein [Pseudooceanicola]MBT9383266.1 hypothetical protein [Pseudooceanicola endophyticus]MXN16411.1 hypothetical protein [Pseudooceanicola albus]
MSARDLAPPARDERFSDWALLRRRGARRLVIAFSGIDCKKGRFAYYDVLARQDCDQLLLNCPDNGWFFDGVPLERGDASRGQTLDFLRELAACYDEVLMLGGSMGAYGALLYGAGLPGAKVLAMSPEIYGGLRRGFFLRCAGVAGPPPGLSALLARSPDFRPWILVGEKVASDLFCLTEVPPARVISLKNCPHTIPAYLESRFGLAALIPALSEDRLEPMLAPLRGEMSRYPDLAALLYLLDLGRLPVARAMGYLGTLPPDLYLRGYLALAIARAFERQDRPDMALRLAAEARTVNPGDMEAQALHDRLWTALEGRPPAPRFRAHVDADLCAVRAYRAQLDQLEALHGPAG